LPAQSSTTIVSPITAKPSRMAEMIRKRGGDEDAGDGLEAIGAKRRRLLEAARRSSKRLRRE
jgi:hypothetical protein